MTAEAGQQQYRIISVSNKSSVHIYQYIYSSAAAAAAAVAQSQWSTLSGNIGTLNAGTLNSDHESQVDLELHMLSRTGMYVDRRNYWCTQGVPGTRYDDPPFALYDPLFGWFLAHSPCIAWYSVFRSQVCT